MRDASAARQRDMRVVRLRAGLASPHTSESLFQPIAEDEPVMESPGDGWRGLTSHMESCRVSDPTL